METWLNVSLSESATGLLSCHGWVNVKPPLWCSTYLNDHVMTYFDVIENVQFTQTSYEVLTPFIPTNSDYEWTYVTFNDLLWIPSYKNIGPVTFFWSMHIFTWLKSCLVCRGFWFYVWTTFGLINTIKWFLRYLQKFRPSC